MKKSEMLKPKINKIWQIINETGEYSDYSYEIIYTYNNQELAEKQLAECKKMGIYDYEINEIEIDEHITYYKKECYNTNNYKIEELHKELEELENSTLKPTWHIQKIKNDIRELKQCQLGNHGYYCTSTIIDLEKTVKMAKGEE